MWSARDAVYGENFALKNNIFLFGAESASAKMHGEIILV
jgi:hypothetical protein